MESKKDGNDVLTLRVSGKDVYKAVENYFKNTIPKSAITQEQVDARIQNRIDYFVNNSIDKLLRKGYSSSQSQIDIMVKEEVKKQVAAAVKNQIVDKLIDKALK